MKKVLIFSLAYYPHVGGAEVAVKEITDRIQNVEFHLITMRFTPEQKAEEHIGNVEVHRILSGNTRLNKFLFQIFAYWKAKELHREHHFDAIWALMAHSTGVPAGLFKASFPKVGYVLNLQEGDPLEHVERTMRPLWPLFVRGFTRADIVQPISNFLGAWARHMGFRGPVEVIPNGANVRHFGGELVPHEGTILVTTSRLVHKNALDDVIRALPELPGVRFRILGTGVEEKKLKDLAQSEGVADRVDFLGHVDHKDMPQKLQSADIFIRPSRSEGQGASFIEAMAAGLPVIATHEGGIVDFLFDERRNPDKETTGWAVDKDSPVQIAKAVKDILANPEKTARVTASARKLATEKYDWDLIAKRMEKEVFAKLFAKS